jgi:hypothetical protein
LSRGFLSNPASIQSIPAAADQEDFVSMGMNTALKNQQILDNAFGILGNRVYGCSTGTRFRVIINQVKGLQKQRKLSVSMLNFWMLIVRLYPDHNRMKELVKSCEILEAVEKVIGKFRIISIDFNPINVDNFVMTLIPLDFDPRCETIQLYAGWSQLFKH